jgi:hypothetical protein
MFDHEHDHHLQGETAARQGNNNPEQEIEGIVETSLESARILVAARVRAVNRRIHEDIMPQPATVTLEAWFWVNGAWERRNWTL